MVRYSNRFLPLLSSRTCTISGEFLPEGGSPGPDQDRSRFRSRFLIFASGGLIDCDTSTGPNEAVNGRDFHFEVRVPSRANRFRLVFERRGEDGRWEEIGSDNISVLEFPSGWIRLPVSIILRKYHLLRTKLFVVIGRVFPWLRDRTPAEHWLRFSAASKVSGPRRVWSERLSESDRHKLWRHVLSSGASFNSLFQYEGKEVSFDTLPVLETSNDFIPKLTVVTPSYNQARFLGATMDSVSAGTGMRIDYIVMDGGSTDHSVEVIRERSSIVRHWQSKPDKGQAAAVAEGFLHADCGPADVMAYLNSDDVFCPGAIDFVLRWFALHPEVDVVYGHRIIIDESGLEVGRWILPPHDPETLSLVDFIPQETLFWRKRVYDAVGGIDPSFQFAMDWDFLLKLNKAGARFERLPWFLGCFRVHSGQKTHLHLNDSGAREIALLRRREHGDTLIEKSLHDAVIKSNVESFWYEEQISRGVRK